MEYVNIKKGKFIERPNRFIAIVEINGKEEVCHVKNTGRCKELLIPGVSVILEESNNPNRKTRYSLIAVYKKGILVNIDSQAPNVAATEWILTSSLFPGVKKVRREVRFGGSRFDIYAETDTQKIFVEVKGVTLEQDGIARFPDAPTDRGIKHILELCEAVKEGYEAYILFVIQMKGIKHFEPNDETHPAFGETLRFAEQNGVHIVAVDCVVEETSMLIDKRMPVILSSHI